jgi:hypothetical protein
MEKRPAVKHTPSVIPATLSNRSDVSMRQREHAFPRFHLQRRDAPITLNARVSIPSHESTREAASR